MINPIDGVCSRFKVKYMYLDKLFNGRLNVKKNGKRVITDVNIFINFEGLYNCIRVPEVEKQIKGATKKEIKHLYRNAISDFINVVAHYREYFKRHEIRTNFFYFYNDMEESYVEYNNTAIVPEYRYHFIETTTSMERLTINSLIADTIPFMRIITEYIDSVYFIGTKRVESSLIPYIIDMEGKFPANMNIIISKDLYDFQYCNYNFLVITKYVNEPVILTKKNLMKFLRHKHRMRTHDKEGRPINYIELSSLLLPFILVILGDRKRSIPGIPGLGFKRAYNALAELYKVGYIFDEAPETMSVNNLCDIIMKSSLSLYTDDIREEILTLYKAYDFEYQYEVLGKGQKDKILDQLRNKSDMVSLARMNDKYFEDYPLMLMELENYEQKSKLEKYMDDSGFESEDEDDDLPDFDPDDDYDEEVDKDEL